MNNSTSTNILRRLDCLTNDKIGSSTFPVSIAGAVETDCSLKYREWMTTEEAAAYLGLSPGALRNMTSNGQVPYHKLGRRNRYQMVELKQLLLSQKRGVSHGN